MAEANELTPRRPRRGLPPIPAKCISDGVAALHSAYDRLRDGLIEHRPADVREGLEKVKLIDLKRLAAELSAGRAPASRIEIEAAVGELIAVTKHLDKVDGPLFHSALVRFVVEEQPTRIGLATAMRKVLLAARFTPSIAEVIETLKAVESDIRSAATRLESLPDRIKEGDAFLFRST